MNAKYELKGKVPFGNFKVGVSYDRFEIPNHYIHKFRCIEGSPQAPINMEELDEKKSGNTASGLEVEGNRHGAANDAETDAGGMPAEDEASEILEDET